jgi:DNA-binding NarL/FixJ family response regulator
MTIEDDRVSLGSRGRVAGEKADSIRPFPRGVDNDWLAALAEWLEEDQDARPMGRAASRRPELIGRRAAETERTDFAALVGTRQRAGSDELGAIPFWLAHPNPLFADHVAWVARRAEDWASLSEIWIEGARSSEVGRSLLTCGAFADIPRQARAAFPLLTWAMAASIAESHSLRTRHVAMMKLILRDAVALHSRWHSHESIDAAVFAGTIWMISLKYLPPVDELDQVKVARQTREAVRRCIEDSLAAGNPPSDLARLVFSVFSAQVLVSSGELHQALDEIGLARLLGSPGYELSWYLHGMEQVCHELLGGGARSHRGPLVSRQQGRGIGLECFLEAGVSMSTASRAYRALELLDSDQVLECLGSLESPTRQDAVTASLSGAVGALREAMWGDAELGLETVDAAIAGTRRGFRDAAEPLGVITLNSARLWILENLGAADLAYEAAISYPPGIRYPVQAAALLWKGEFSEAESLAEGALLQGGTWPQARLRLTAIRAAALAAGPNSADAEVAKRALASIKECWARQSLLPLASLPPSSREALLDVASAEAEGPDVAVVATVRERLQTLRSNGRLDRSTIRLTKREAVLLPLLASADSVPEIAKGLHVSPNTLRKQVVTLREKFNAPNRSSMVRRARELGFLSDLF